MKKHRPQERTAQAGPAQPATAELTSARRRRRGWLFRALALVFPLLLVAAVELALRLAGTGHPTAFFLKSRHDGREVWTDNQRFGWRFFPPAIARTPEPLLLPVARPTNTCRIVLFGESAAMGDPEPDFGPARVLEALLRAQYPGVRFEVVNAAMTAINSHVIREIARDATGLRADLWIVYAGHNEVVGPYGAGTIFGAQVPPLPLVRASLAFKATHLGQWMDRMRSGSRFDEWTGMEMFLKQQVRRDDPRMKSVHTHFEKNLEALLQLGRDAGTQVLLCTVASNLKDCPPFASQHKPGLVEAERAAWQKSFEAGQRLFAEQKHAAALDHFLAAARLDDEFAALHYRVGQCQLALGRSAEARQSFVRARDLDTLRFRADTRINEITRQLAARRPDVPLLDAEEIFARHSTNGIAGDEFLLEHVHFNFDGNYLLARSLADRIAPLLPAWVRSRAMQQASLLSADECARRLALTDWNRLQIADEVQKRLRQPPFTNQLGRQERDRRWRDTVQRLRAAESLMALQTAVEQTRTALALSPEDWVLHGNLARLLEAAGDWRGAMAAWREVMRLLPHGAEALYRFGNLADTLGRNLDVADYFREALRRKPDAVEVLNGLGLVLAADGQTAEAIAQFEKALKIKPRFVEAHLNLGVALAKERRYDEAIRHFRETLRLQPGHVQAAKFIEQAERMRQ